MALSQDQWYEKLKGLVQSWVTDNPGSVANFKAIAKALSEQQTVADNHIAETYIDSSSDEYTAIHGDERSVYRLPGENLSSYKARVKLITNKSNLPAIRDIVQAQLIRGQPTIIEHHNASNFLNRDSYLNRNIIDYQVLYNAFTILIDYQIPEATSFLNRESFFNREFLNGSSISSDEVFSNIIKAVNENKAFGTVYRLIERANP
jgi:hypothetical protein